jgi:hypothetical protein
MQPLQQHRLFSIKSVIAPFFFIWCFFKFLNFFQNLHEDDYHRGRSMSRYGHYGVSSLDPYAVDEVSYGYHPGAIAIPNRYPYDPYGGHPGSYGSHYGSPYTSLSYGGYGGYGSYGHPAAFQTVKSTGSRSHKHRSRSRRRSKSVSGQSLIIGSAPPSVYSVY